MPISWHASDGGTWVEIEFSDPYTATESERVMQEIYADAGVKRPLRLLVDVRESSPPDTNFIVNATTFWQLHVKHMWAARIAVVVATEGQMGKGQMSARTAEANELPFTVRVFRDAEYDDALRWLHEPA